MRYFGSFNDFPLSGSQKAIWLGEKLDPETNAFRIPLLIEILGPLNKKALKNAFNTLIERHEALRTIIPLVNSVALQRIYQEANIEIDTVKIAKNDLATLFEFTSSISRVCLDPSISTLRASLAEFNSTTHYLFIEIHHLICDGWSTQIISRDISTLYRHCLQTEKSDYVLPELEYQFVDWSEWQNTQEENIVNRDYWGTRLFGVKTLSPLITGNTTDNAIEAEYLSAKVSDEQLRHIELQCIDLSTTPFEWFLTCLGLLISKYQNNDEIWISTPWANRSQEEFFETVGCFVDTIPLRLQVNSKLSFQELMGQIKGQVRSDFSHADQSGEIIRRLLRESLPSTVSAQPAILFAYQISFPKINFGQEIEANAIPVENKNAKYDFTFRVEPNDSNNSTQIIFEYRKNIIAPSDAEHFLADYLKIISVFAIDFKKDLTKFTPQFEAPKQIRFAQKDSHVDIELKTQTYSSSLQLAKIWGQLLGQNVSPTDNFFTLGGDSILALRLISHLREDGILCKPRDIFENPTPESFANHLILKKIGADRTQSIDANEYNRYLLPIEKWFFDLNLINDNHWYQALSLNIPAGLDVNTLSKALNFIHAKHQAFSYRWKKDDLGIEFFIQNDSLFKLIELPDEQSFEDIGNDFKNINIETGPLSIVFYKNEDSTRIVWVIHHLISDTLSWRVLIDDLIKFIFQGNFVQKTPSIRNRNPSIISGPLADQYISYWNHQSELVKNWGTLNDSASIYSKEKKMRYDFSDSITNEVDALEKLGFNAEEILLTSLLGAFSSHNFPDGINITLEHHGRDLDVIESIDSIGWYTALAPFPLDRCNGHLTDQLARVVSGLARWKTMAPSWLMVRENLSQDAGSLPKVSFNYLGRLQQPVDAPIHITPLPSLPLHDPSSTRPFLHEILLWRDADGLHLFWLTSDDQDEPKLKLWLLAMEQHIHDLYKEINTKGRSLEIGPLAAGLIFHTTQSDDKNTYIGQVNGKITGALDLELLQSCWNSLVKRHDSLRTCFPTREDGRMIRWIQNQIDSSIKYIDLSLHHDSQDSLAQELARKELAHEFDLSRPPLARLALVKLNSNHWDFYLTYHHAILDGWSLPILLDELIELYDNKTLKLRELPPTTEKLTRAQFGRNPIESKTCWQEILKLRRDSGKLMLPLHSHASNSINDLSISNELRDQLNTLVSTQGVTLGSLLQAIWAMVLQSLGYGSTPCFGLIVSDRDPAIQNINKLVGLTINTLPMVVDIEESDAVLTIAKNIQNLFAKMQSHVEIDLPTLQRWSNNPGEPLFETLFVLENYPRNRMSGTNISFSSIEMIEQAHYPITLAVIPDEQMLFRLSCRGGLVSDELASSILKRLQGYLTILAAHPTIKCRELKIAYQATSENKSTLNRKNLASKFRSIYSIIQEVAIQYPELIAVRQDFEAMSYKQLISSSSDYAAQLASHGIGRGSIVALACYRTTDWIIALVACSRLGAAFLSIDRDLPIARQEQIIRLSKVNLLVSNPYLELGINLAIKQISIEDLKKSSPTLATPPIAELIEDDLAYLVFTSGSTGEPKKVAVPHRGINNFKTAQADDFDIQPGDSLYQFASPSYDAFISELITSLGTGATLCLPKNGRSQVHEDLIGDLILYGITHITLTPSLIYSLPKNALNSVRTLVVAGERSSAKQLIDYRTPTRCIVNAYGPSEATCSTTQSNWTTTSDPVLGLPIPGFEIHLLDSKLLVMESGVIAEIYIGGVGLAWGYLDNPRLTAEKFIPNPFSIEPGQRLYKTGDLAYQDRQGQLNYIGRADNQIKLRGQRIEPGEVEFAINHFPGVIQSHVKIQFNGETPHLAAWILSDKLEPKDLFSIQEKIQSLMPAAMLPSHWLLTNKWPTNQFGKVDYSLLPRAEILCQANSSSPPEENSQTNHEFLQILSIWGSTLNKNVKGNETLIQLGGDSITAMRLVAQINELGYQIKANDLLSGMTPSQIAKQHKKIAVVEDNLSVAPLAPAQALFLKRFNNTLPNWIFSAQINLEKDVDIELLGQIMLKIIQRHDSLRSFIDTNNYLQSVRDLNESQVIISPEISSSEKVIALINSLLSVESGPNFMAFIDSEKIILAGHHLWLDVVSLLVIFDEIQILMNAPERFSGMAHSYLNWSSQLAQQVNDGIFDQEIDYWNQVTKITPQLKLLVSGNNPLESEVTRHITSITHDKLKIFSSLEIESLLLTALASSVFDESQSGELLIELERHGRNTLTEFNTAEIVGWFTASFPIRIVKSKNAELEMSSTMTLLNTMPSNGCGFTPLIALSHKNQEKLAINGFFSHCQISFNYLGNLSSEKNHIPGLGYLDVNARLLNAAENKLTRQRPISIEAWTTNTGVEIRWTYSETQWGSAKNIISRFEEYIQIALSRNYLANTIGIEEFDSLLDELNLSNTKL